MRITLLLRWAARLLSLTLAILFVAFALGEGLPPLLPASGLSLSLGLLGLCLTSLLFAWRFEMIGAIVGIVSGAGFYVSDFCLSGFSSFPGGWVFPLLLVTPLLYLAAAIAERRRPAVPTPAVDSCIP